MNAQLRPSLFDYAGERYVLVPYEKRAALEARAPRCIGRCNPEGCTACHRVELLDDAATDLAERMARNPRVLAETVLADADLPDEVRAITAAVLADAAGQDWQLWKGLATKLEPEARLMLLRDGSDA